MTDERGKRAEELFLAALELPEGERRAFLDRALDDDDLRREVESLIEADGRAESIFGELHGAAAEDLARLRDDGGKTERTGERFGSYVVDGTLGRGGMGEVYLAHRADRAYDAAVAIKVLPANALRSEPIARFERERQILARLDHPNIARLMDAGWTEAGEPYFVMEYVEGSAVDLFCDARELPIESRLELFLEICGAVEQAHRSLVVHRDLKPANVLVGPDGVPKLLDFGIAKLLEDESSPARTSLTRTDVRPMTPSHASPEQIEGGAITTATDVYGLGVLLYELLAGRLPHEGETPLNQAILERDPTPPSTACTEEAARVRSLSPRQLRRRLAGDLDTIVLKALDKDPAHRYGSASALSADIERHLRGLPIEARRPTLRYRVSKFVRRHRVAVAAAATAAVAVVTLSIALAFLAARLADERDRARTEQQKAEEVVSLMVEMLSAPDPEKARGEEVTAREILDRGADRLSGELGDQPEVRATLLDVIGQVYHGLGLYDSATSVLGEALSLRVDVLEPEHPATIATLHHLAEAIQKTGDFAEAERLYRQALETERKARGPDSLEVAGLLDKLAEITQTKGDYRECEQLLRQALSIRERLAPEDEVGRSTTLFRLGQALHEQERLAEAEKIFREVLAIQSRGLGEDHPDTMAVLVHLGDVIRRQSRGAEAEEIFRRLLSIQRRVLGPRHPRVAYGLSGVGYSLVAQGKLAEAVPFFEEALAIRREELGEQHPAVMVSLSALADTLLRQGELQQAEALYRQALDGTRRGFPPNFPGIAFPLSGLAETLRGQGRAAEATPFLREALKVRLQAMGPDNVLVAKTMSDLAACLMDREMLDEAESLLLRSRSTLEASDPPAPDHYRAEVEEGLARLESLQSARASSAQN